jgi:hypothetical protein
MKMVVLFDEFLQVVSSLQPRVSVLISRFKAYLYPSTPAAQASFAKIAASLSFPLRINTEDTESGGRVRTLGHRLPPVAYPTWSLSLPVDEDIQALLPAAARGPVASLAKSWEIARLYTNISTLDCSQFLLLRIRNQCVVFMPWMV